MTTPTKSPSETKPAPGNQTHECTKPGCYFCYATQDRPEQPTEYTLQSKLNFVSTSWSRDEMDILWQHHSAKMPVLVELLPNRSYDQIKNKRRRFRQRLGMPKLPRGNFSKR